MQTLTWNIPDGIYNATNGSSHYIVRFEGGCSKECMEISRCGSGRYNGSSGFHKEWGTYTPADECDSQLMRDCIEAKEIVDKPALQYESYPIF